MTDERRRLMIVDDHPIVRHGIAQLLAQERDLVCDLHADSADQALQMLRTHKVDLVIADISMPGLSGLDLTRRIQATWPQIPVLVLSMHEDAIYAERAVAAGARGYLNKQGATERLVDAVRRLLHGGVYFAPAIEQRMLSGLRGQPVAAPPSALAGLTEREFEVLQMLAQGLSSAEMGERINRSVKSIETYRASLRLKLGAKTVADLTRLAIEYCSR
jgi:two-component system, NarL family, response regulator NreC